MWLLIYLLLLVVLVKSSVLYGRAFLLLLYGGFMHIFYIHGFLSGPNATKANLLKDYVASLGDEKLYFDALSFSDIPQHGFKNIIDKLDLFTAEYPNEEIALVGSSLGGFYATLLCERYGCRCVLLNPCIHPQDYFIKLAGPHYNEHTQCHFAVDEAMLEFLTALDKSIKLRCDLIEVYLGSQDEVLDYHKALNFYRDCTIHFIEGEDHAFTHDFKALMPKIVSYLTAN